MVWYHRIGTYHTIAIYTDYTHWEYEGASIYKRLVRSVQNWGKSTKKISNFLPLSIKCFQIENIGKWLLVKKRKGKEEEARKRRKGGGKWGSKAYYISPRAGFFHMCSGQFLDLNRYTVSIV